ncbi:c-type cytochrome [Psychrobacter sp. bablab_jr014]|uniref:c-type cytochrome n=1 Tax=unclassified Psychrobacter TaxID=196806 RepID=UPI003A4C7066
MHTVHTPLIQRSSILANLGRLSAAMVFMLGLSQTNAADIPKIYQDSCAACHDTGALNAPKKGDTATWQKLKNDKGMPALIKAVKGGMIQMPAGGLCGTCSDDDYRQLIEYMSK